MDSFPEAVNYICAHNIIVHMSPVDDSPGEEYLYIDVVLVTLRTLCSKLKAELCNATVKGA